MSANGAGSEVKRDRPCLRLCAGSDSHVSRTPVVRVTPLEPVVLGSLAQQINTCRDKLAINNNRLLSLWRQIRRFKPTQPDRRLSCGPVPRTDAMPDRGSYLATPALDATCGTWWTRALEPRGEHRGCIVSAGRPGGQRTSGSERPPVNGVVGCARYPR